MTALKAIECAECGMEFAVSAQWEDHRRQDKRAFYCPNGHPQRFTGKSYKDKLAEAEANSERLLARLKQKDAEIEDAHAVARRALAEKERLTKRVSAGVCTCCNRTFQNLARHMKTKHSGALQ